MPAYDETTIIAQTKKWISIVVIGCNFCPFASKVFNKQTISYEVLPEANTETVLKAVMKTVQQLDEDNNIETSLLILPGCFSSFEKYLQLVGLTEMLLSKENYEGIYQVASFHPQYLFAGSINDDPCNYTNRSPYPMLHFLREDAVSKVVDSYADIHEIPARNISFSKEKGLIYMKALLEASLEDV